MNVSHPPLFIGSTITIKAIRDFILDNSLTSSDAVLLNQADFDEIALEYKETYKQRLTIPYVLLGVLVRENDNKVINRGHAVVIENDDLAIRRNSMDKFDPSRIVYRCESCGGLIDFDGGELSAEVLESNATYLNKFGRDVTVKHETGFCCKNVLYPDTETSAFEKKEIDYSVVAGKLLMDLNDEDFEKIELFRKDVDDFGFLYYCRNERLGKIYFTKNEDSYSIRGYMLRESKKIYMTDQLIKAVIDWRNIK